MCSGGLHRTTKTLVPLHCYKPACDLVKWILLKYDNKRDILFVTKLSISVLLSKHSFKFRTALINGLVGQTLFFYQSWGKNQAMLGVPHFHPITFEAPLTRAPVQAAHPISSAYVTLSCASQHFSSVNFRHCMRHTMDNFQQSFYFHLPSYPWPH